MKARGKATDVINSLDNPLGGSYGIKALALVKREGAVRNNSASLRSSKKEADNPELAPLPEARNLRIRSFAHFGNMLLQEACKSRLRGATI